MAVAISREHARHSHSFSNLYCFEGSDILYDHPLTFLINKCFPFSKKLNEFIQMSNEGGLVDKWLTIYRTRVPRNRREQVYNQMKLEHFHGVLIVWSIMLSIVLSTFLCEQIVYRRARTMNPSRFYLMADMFIDPDRHFMLENKFV